MEALDFLKLFYKNKRNDGDYYLERTGENLYGLICGIKALETNDFSMISNHVIENINEFSPSMSWVEGILEAIIIKNGNGDMVNTVNNVVKEINKHKAMIELELAMSYALAKTKVIVDYFEAFFRCYKALMENPKVYRDGKQAFYRAIAFFIKKDKNCEKLNFFDEIFLNHIKTEDFSENVNIYLLNDNLKNNRTTVKYLIHMAKMTGSKGKKKIMRYLNKNERKRKFIRVRGARRVLKQVFGQEVTGFNILKLLSNGEIIALSQAQIDFFEKPSKLIGHFQNNVILEIDKKQYLFKMDKHKKRFLCSSIKKKVKADESESFFADAII